MATKLKFEVNDAGVRKKLKALDAAAANMQPVYQAIGQTILRRIQLCFKLGIDPWGSPWAKLKWRAARTTKGSKYRKGQLAANAAGAGGQPLVNTGRLRRSITSTADSKGVTIGTNLIQAPLMQFGGTIKPKSAKRLVFPGPNGALVFAKKVTVPGRPFLPLKKGQNVVALPPTWSADLTRALRAYFTNQMNKGGA